MIQKCLIKRQKYIVLTLIFLIVLTMTVSLRIGQSQLTIKSIIRILTGYGTTKENFIFYSIRLPRIIITLLSGMALALSGSILQGITRNDLSDPGIIGINSGAGVAITIFILFFSTNSSYSSIIIPVVAFIGSFITAIIIYKLSYSKGYGFNPINLILVGIGFSMALSGLMIVVVSSADRIKVEFIVKWLSGSIWGADWSFILGILPWLVILVPFVVYKSNQLNILRLNESVAIGLGMDVDKERRQLLLAAVALAASSVSVTGAVSFIGLMAPHIARNLVGHRNQLCTPVSILCGGWLLLISDTIGRVVFQPNGIPAGIMSALIGSPYFIYLLIKK